METPLSVHFNRFWSRCLQAFNVFKNNILEIDLFTKSRNQGWERAVIKATLGRCVDQIPPQILRVKMTRGDDPGRISASGSLKNLKGCSRYPKNFSCQLILVQRLMRIVLNLTILYNSY